MMKNKNRVDQMNFENETSNQEMEQKLERIKLAYANKNMSQDAYEKMRERMQEAKEENKVVKLSTGAKTIGWAVVAAIALMILPNTSSSVAYAMGNMPVVGGFFRAITVREYHYDGEKQTAEIMQPELRVEPENSLVTKTDEKKNEDATIANETEKTVKEVNEDMQKLVDQYIAEFKESLEKDAVQATTVSSEVVCDNEQYFTLKLTCVEEAASSYTQEHYYTIDKTTGKRIALADLFADGTDYKTIISDNIKQQMKEQMDADENCCYWLDDPDFPEDNFNEIKEETAFYINEQGELVICFESCEVAPAYMGNVSFTIPKEVIAL